MNIHYKTYRTYQAVENLETSQIFFKPIKRYDNNNSNDDMHLLQEGGKLHPSQIIPIDKLYMCSNCKSQLCGSKGLRGSFTTKIHLQKHFYGE